MKTKKNAKDVVKEAAVDYKAGVVFQIILTKLF